MRWKLITEMQAENSFKAFGKNPFHTKIKKNLTSDINIMLCVKYETIQAVAIKPLIYYRHDWAIPKKISKWSSLELIMCLWIVHLKTPWRFFKPFFSSSSYLKLLLTSYHVVLLLFHSWQSSLKKGKEIFYSHTEK